MSDFAVRAVDVSKRFLIHDEKRSSIKERFVRGRAPKAREFWALRNASFEIPRGQTFGIIGHNGSGKSTALKVLTGVYRPTSGSVEVNGRVSALLELGAGFHPELTGRENIRLNGSILGFSPKQVESMMDDIIDFSGVEEFIDTPVKVYSSGMYVRLGFAIAVKVDPEILLVDEVIAVGDEQFQRKCFDYLYELRRRGATVVLVSHGMSQVEDLCDQVAWLDHGAVQAVGPAREVVKSYIRRVNQNENAAIAGEDSPSGSVSGSGDVVIGRLEIEGAMGSTLITGEPAVFRMGYRADVSLEGVVFGLEFLTDSGICVCASDTVSEVGLQVRPGHGVLEFRVPGFPLAEGAYNLTVSAVSRGHVHFRDEEAARVRVESGTRHFEGLFEIPGEWSQPG